MSSAREHVPAPAWTDEADSGRAPAVRVANLSKSFVIHRHRTWTLKERLRPGGKLVITTPNFHSAWPLVEAVLNRFGEVSYDFQHINKFVPVLLEQLLRSHGLEQVRVEPFLFLAPFAASIRWELADRVAKLERGAIERRLGMLLIGSAMKPA